MRGIDLQHSMKSKKRKRGEARSGEDVRRFARKDVTHGPLRCADVPLYDSAVDSHAHGISSPPTLVVVGALMLIQWIVQYGTSTQTD